MKNSKVFGIAVICIALLASLSFVPHLVHASPDSFNMYVTIDEEGVDVALKVFLVGREGPLSEATVEYELFTAQGLPLGVKGEMGKAASGVWCSLPLPLAGNLGEVCALVKSNPQGYPAQERRYYFPAGSSMTATADELGKSELEKIKLGTQAIRQEFVWDDASGTFQTVNLYTTGEIEDYIADMEQVLTSGASGAGLILGRDCGLPYYYWEDGASWQTIANRTRYKGYDARAEAAVSRGDNIYTQGCADGYTRVASYEPWASIVLANGWKVDVTQEYTQWGHEVNITAPDGRWSSVWGDPHLLQAGGTQQQELAALGQYVFALGGYILNLSCMKSNAGFSLVTAMNITGPDNYLLSIGRNGEVKVSGGSGGGAPQARPSLPGAPEIEFIEAPSDGATLNSSEVSIKVEANEFLQQATLHFGDDSYLMTDMDGGKGLRWEKSLSGLTPDTYSFHVTGVDLSDNSGTSSEWQVSLQAGELCVATYGSIQAAIDAAQEGDRVLVPTGTYNENLTIDKSITLQGGWGADCSSRISTDPADTVIDGVGTGRVITINGSYNVTIEGLTLRNGDASGQGGAIGDADSGGGIYARDATLIIENCNITGNVASNTGLAYGGGAYLESLADGSEITDCTIKDNFAAGDANITECSFGGGFYIKDSGGITVTGNTIEGNIASLGDVGQGGGVYAAGSTLNFNSNEVLSNTAGTNWGAGGGLYLDNVHGQVNGNIIQGNIAGQSGSGNGGGASIEGSDATVHGNTVSGNTASQNGDGQGGGLDIFTSSITLSANTIIGNRASGNGATTEWGGGLFLNTILNVVTNLTNNIVVQNEAAEGSGIYVLNWGSGYATDFGVNLYHNTLADNSGDGIKCGAGKEITLAMTNNIISSHSMGISTMGVVNATIGYTLFFNNTNDGIVGSNPVYGAPAFVGGENYHITDASAAIDAGVDTGIITDIDGQTRPQGGSYDIGADEHFPGITVAPMNLDFGNVTVGEDSDPQKVTITNNGDADLTVDSISITGTDASEFSQTNDCPGILSPGANCTVNVTFSPSSEVATSANLTIQSNDLAQSTVNVILSGTGVGGLTLLTVAGVTGEVNCDALAGVTITLYDDSVVKGIATSDGSGNYTLAASISETGEYEVVASKTGYKDESQSINITELGQEYTLDFHGDHGLIPDTDPGMGAMDYFLHCMNLYLKDWGECNIGMDKFLAVMNAYLKVW